MASYTGTARTQYKGQALDTTAARDLPDPTTGRVALFTDIERAQWGLVTSWGHPGVWIECAVKDAGTSGSSGSYAAVVNRFPMFALVPPRVEYAHVTVYYTGALRFDLSSSVDSVGIRLYGLHAQGAGSFDNLENASSVSTTGVNGTASAEPRAIKLVSDAHQAQSSLVTITVDVQRTDVEPDHQGYGGMLWGIRLAWHRPALATFALGDTADSLSA